MGGLWGPERVQGDGKICPFLSPPLASLRPFEKPFCRASVAVTVCRKSEGCKDTSWSICSWVCMCVHTHTCVCMHTARCTCLCHRWSASQAPQSPAPLILPDWLTGGWAQFPRLSGSMSVFTFLEKAQENSMCFPDFPWKQSWHGGWESALVSRTEMGWTRVRRLY